MALKFDEIGYWSEIKLDIIEKYALEYSKILTRQKHPELHHVYICLLYTSPSPRD